MDYFLSIDNLLKMIYNYNMKLSLNFKTMVKIKNKKNKKFLIILAAILFLPSLFSLAQSCPGNTQYGDTWATLVGEIQDSGGDPNITAWFEWGTSPSLGNQTPSQSLYVSYTPYRFCSQISGLQPCQTYYYRAVSRNSGGTNYGQTYSFRTQCGTSLYVSCYASPNPANLNQTVTFYANVSGGTGVYSYSWSGACSGFSSTCSRSFSSPGTYTATLVVTSGSQTQSATCSVNVSSGPSFPITINPLLTNQNPVPIIAFTPETILPGTIVTFDASNSYDPDGYIVFYEWRVNGELASTNKTFSRALASGTYRIKLTVTDNQGASASKEILINVGRNVFVTRTRVVTQNVPILTSQGRLVDVLLDSSYLVYSCEKNEIQVTLVNNTSVNRKVTLTVYGDAENWFKPNPKILILKPRSTTLVKWEVNPACDVKEGVYAFKIDLKTPGANYDYDGNLEVKTRSNFLSPLLGFIGGIFQNFWLLLLLLLILLINIYMWYRFLKKKEEAK